MKYPEITYKDFSTLMAKRKRTLDDLVDYFRGKIDDPRDYFEGVLSCRRRVDGRPEDRSTVVIPYRSVIEYYQTELGYLKAAEAEEQSQAEKRKRGPVSEEQRQILAERLRKARDMRKSGD
jgi:hypothetical protein